MWELRSLFIDDKSMQRRQNSSANNTRQCSIIRCRERSCFPDAIRKVRLTQNRSHIEVRVYTAYPRSAIALVLEYLQWCLSLSLVVLNCHFPHKYQILRYKITLPLFANNAYNLPKSLTHLEFIFYYSHINSPSINSFTKSYPTHLFRSRLKSVHYSTHLYDSLESYTVHPSCSYNMRGTACCQFTTPVAFWW